MTSPVPTGNVLGRTLLVSHKDLDGFVTAAMLYAYLTDIHDGSLPLAVDLVDFPMGKAYGGLWESCYSQGMYHTGELHELGGPPETVMITDFPLTWVPPGVQWVHLDHHVSPFDRTLTTKEQHVLLTDMVARRAPRGGLIGELSMRKSSAPSAAHMLMERLNEKGWVAPLDLQDATRLATQVDTLSFATPQDAIALRRAPMLFDFAVSVLPVATVREACLRLAGGDSLYAALILPNAAALEAKLTEMERNLAIARSRRVRMGPMGSAILMPVRADKAVKLSAYEDPTVRYAATIDIDADWAGGAKEWTVRANVSRAKPTWRAPLPAGYQDPDMVKVVNDLTGAGGGHAFSAGSTKVFSSYAEAVACGEEWMERLSARRLLYPQLVEPATPAARLDAFLDRVQSGHSAPPPDTTPTAQTMQRPSWPGSDGVRHSTTVPSGSLPSR